MLHKQQAVGFNGLVRKCDNFMKNIDYICNITFN